MEKQMSLNWTQ